MKQFSSFCGLDNRRDVFIMLTKLGDGLPEKLANERRAVFLQSLLPHSVTSLAGLPLHVDPCNPVEAYNIFVAMTGVLGIPIDLAAGLLEAEVRHPCSLSTIAF